MTQEVQVACGFSVTTCSAIGAFTLAWMPVLQLIAVAIAILSGVITVLVGLKKLRSKE